MMNRGRGISAKIEMIYAAASANATTEASARESSFTNGTHLPHLGAHPRAL